jgi:PilZ domain-containing protein
LCEFMEKRPESRVSADIPVRVWGMDADGRPFFQSATACSLSPQGAKLWHMRHTLKAGEIIGIQYGDKKARFEVVWVKSSVLPEASEAGLRLLANQSIPWAEVTNEEGSAAPARNRSDEKRRFLRHKVLFPIEISFQDERRSHMQCNATDIGGRGCYVESLVPLQLETQVIITFWIDSEKMKTSGVVRTSDPGVGMGIEFTALEAHIQQRLQEYLDKLDKGFASAATQGS